MVGVDWRRARCHLCGFQHRVGSSPWCRCLDRHHRCGTDDGFDAARSLGTLGFSIPSDHPLAPYRCWHGDRRCMVDSEKLKCSPHHFHPFPASPYHGKKGWPRSLAGPATLTTSCFRASFTAPPSEATFPAALSEAFLLEMVFPGGTSLL